MEVDFLIDMGLAKNAFFSFFENLFKIVFDPESLENQPALHL